MVDMHGGTYEVEWLDAVLDRLVQGICIVTLPTTRHGTTVPQKRQLRASALKKLESLRGSTVAAVLKRFATTQLGQFNWTLCA